MTTTEKSCPYCGEQILAVAIKCKHCGTMLAGAPNPGSGGSIHSGPGISRAHTIPRTGWRTVLGVVVGTLPAVSYVIYQVEKATDSYFAGQVVGAHTRDGHSLLMGIGYGAMVSLLAGGAFGLLLRAMLPRLFRGGKAILGLLVAGGTYGVLLIATLHALASHIIRGAFGDLTVAGVASGLPLFAILAAGSGLGLGVLLTPMEKSTAAPPR